MTLQAIADRILPWTQDPETRALRELEKKLNREAQYYGRIIRQRLTRLGICYRYPQSRKDFLEKGVQEIEWVRSVGTPEAIYLMIDTMRLPRRVSVSDLGDDDVVRDLSVNCGRPVKFTFETGSGAWYIISRKSGVWGIKKRINFSDMLKHWPETSKDLLVPLGIGENRELWYRSLARMPHALIGGATRAGKSTIMHAWITALALKNDPGTLRMCLVDLKGGTELTRYQRLPHMVDGELFGLKGDKADEIEGFVKEPKGVIPLLVAVRNEMDKRLRRFERAGGIQNISIWNYRRRANKLPRVVIFFDELNVLMLDSGYKGKAQDLLSDIGARGAAPGMHLVLATQSPRTAVVPPLVKSNIDTRLAFRVPDNPSSMVILDTTEAAKFDDNTPQGRYIYRSGIEKTELQGPMITAGTIQGIVRDIVEGRDESSATHMPPEDVFRFAIEQLNGSFSKRMLLANLPQDQVSQPYILRLGQEYEGEIIEVDGNLYEMIPSSGPKPRRLVRVEGSKDV